MKLKIVLVGVVFVVIGITAILFISGQTVEQSQPVVGQDSDKSQAASLDTSNSEAVSEAESTEEEVASAESGDRPIQPSGFDLLEREVVAAALTPAEKRMVLGTAVGICKGAGIQNQPASQAAEVVKAFEASERVLNEFRTQTCVGVPDGLMDQMNREIASQETDDPVGAEIGALSNILRETPNESLALEKLEAIAQSTASPDTARSATASLIASAPRKSSLGEMSAHLTTDNQRLKEIQYSAYLLAHCPSLGQCGPGRVQYVQVCRDTNQCRPGESLNQFYRRVYSPEEAQAIERMSAMLAPRFQKN